MSAGVKRGDRRLNLGLRTKTALGHAYGGSKWVPEYCLDRTCAAQRPPPMTPARVEGLLRSGVKKFTNKADVETVADLYRSYFEGVTSTADQLTFSSLQWGDAEAVALAAVLPEHIHLNSLDLSRNMVGPVGAAALSSFVTVSASLTKIESVCPKFELGS